MTTPEPDTRVRNLGHLMKVDATTATVTSRLRERGIRAIVLKGPSFGRWLYDDRTERLYSDTDLLVSSAQERALREVLTELGFEVAVPRHELDRPVPATNWIRRRGGSSVDVHVGLTGAGVSHEEQWEALSAGAGTLEVGGAEVEVLSIPARTLHVVLHAAQHGRDPRPLADLIRAIERVPEETWREAAALARRLDAGPAFAGGLRLLDEGARLAERLGLPPEDSVELILRREQPPLALGMKWLSEMPGFRARARLVRSKLFPPAEVVAVRPEERRGVGLARAYLRHLYRMTRLAVPAWKALRRARREAAGTPGAEPGKTDVRSDQPPT